MMHYNKKKILITIIIDLVAIVALVVAVYLLMFKDLNQWQGNIATALIVIALPVIFYSSFTGFASGKYDKLKREDDKLWEEALEEQENNDEKEA